MYLLSVLYLNICLFNMVISCDLDDDYLPRNERLMKRKFLVSYDQFNDLVR